VDPHDRRGVGQTMTSFQSPKDLVAQVRLLAAERDRSVNGPGKIANSGSRIQRFALYAGRCLTVRGSHDEEEGGMGRGFRGLLPLAVAGVTAIPLLALSVGSGEGGAAAGEVGVKEKREKGEKRESSFNELAVREVARARRAFGDDDGAKTAPGEYLMQSAIVFAILDLADAVRSNHQAVSG
jgi:hypothetical protein